MAPNALPAIPVEEVRKHSTGKSCYVTLGAKVFDVTSFLSDHPGGADLILDHIRDNGHDVEGIMMEELSHTHTEVAYEILEEHLIGFCDDESAMDKGFQSKNRSQILSIPAGDGDQAELRRLNNHANGMANGRTNGNVSAPASYSTGLSSEEDLSKETDYNQDYKTHHFLDLNRPLFMQMLFADFGKEFYLEQVHRPRHYRGGDSAPLFGNFLEPLSKTPWWVIPTIWLPCIAFGTYRASQGLPLWQLVPYWVLGTCIWTLVEYGLHRMLFHIDYYLPDHPIFLTLHFLLHGIHHYLPMDRYRLVMPPTLFVILAAPFWRLAHTVFAYNWYAATAVYCGGIFGYVCYDMTHYFLHHSNLPAYWKELKKYHLKHHFADYNNGFGVTSRFWDWVFGTELLDGPPRPKVIKTT